MPTDDSMGPVEAEPRTEVDVLRNRIYQLETCGIVELAVINPNVMDYMRHWEDRVETTEAQFIKLWRELAASQAEVERLKEALRKMHRRAQCAEGQVQAVHHALTMWRGKRIMKERDGYLARAIVDNVLADLNRRIRRAIARQERRE